MVAVISRDFISLSSNMSNAVSNYLGAILAIFSSTIKQLKSKNYLESIGTGRVAWIYLMKRLAKNTCK